MKVAVIVATLGRPSLQVCLDALKAQTLKRAEGWGLLTWTGGPNEYAARNEAAKEAGLQGAEILAFTDDDCVPPPDWLEKGLAHFQADPELKLLTGPLEGDMWNQGWMKLDKVGWFVGANIWVRKSAFDEVGGFEALWGLDPPPRGWRGDTDLGWRMIDRFGERAYLHAPDVRMVHPKSMQSQFDSRVEEKFYLRWRRKCIEEFCPVDPRLDQFVVQQKIETAPEIVDYLNWLNDRFFGRARPRSGLFYACYHCELDFGKLSEYQNHLALNHLSPTQIPQDGIEWYVPPYATNYVPLEPHEKNIVRWMEGVIHPPTLPPFIDARPVGLAVVEPKGTFIDIGAERGLYSLSLREYFTRVYAVEPYLDYMKSLMETVKLNPSRPFIFMEKAAWDHEGMVNLGRFEINQKAEWSASETEQGIQVVPAITVDSLGVKDCRLLKVDAEGQGVRVLRGAEETLKTVEMVLFEIHELGGSMDESLAGRKALMGAGLERRATWYQAGAVHELWNRKK